MQQKLHATINIKSLSEEGVFSGYASIYDEIDSQNDCIREGAFQTAIENAEKNGKHPKMLWQHNPSQPIGKWLEIKEDDRGLFVKGQIFLDIQKGFEAYKLIKEGVIDGLSIGFRIKQASRRKNHRIIEDVDLLEISLVTFPANALATIQEVKEVDTLLSSLIRLNSLFSTV
jgi:HK97 family phage prohead protease